MTDCCRPSTSKVLLTKCLWFLSQDFGLLLQNKHGGTKKGWHCKMCSSGDPHRWLLVFIIANTFRKSKSKCLAWENENFIMKLVTLVNADRDLVPNEKWCHLHWCHLHLCVTYFISIAFTHLDMPCKTYKGMKWPQVRQSAHTTKGQGRQR